MVRRLLAFIRDEKGVATLEFVLWVPPMLFMLLMITDASVLYLTYTDMFNVSRDVARRVSVGAMTVEDVPDYVQERSLLGGRTYTVGSYSGAGVIIEMMVIVGDASVFFFFMPVLSRTMGVRVEMRREPTLVPALS